MNRDEIFYQETGKNKVEITDSEDLYFSRKASIYLNHCFELAKALEIPDIPRINVIYRNEYTNDDIVEKLLELELFASKAYSRIISNDMEDSDVNTVYIDDNWKLKSTSYISYIRVLVESSDVDSRLRDSILKKLNILQGEIDRSQAKFDSAIAVWLDLTEAVGQGVKNLEPAVKLIGKLTGGLRGLRRSLSNDIPKQLPPPEDMGLPELGDGEDDVEE